MASKKIAEGAEHLKEAEKCLKTGIFKWKPDLDGAASEYSKAAVDFKNGRAYDKAAVSHLKCADIQTQLGSAYHAAKSLEAAASMFKEMKKLDKVAGLTEQAVALYLEHGTPDTAIHSLEKAAKMIEYELPESAVKLLLRACDISDGEDNPRQCAELVGKAARIHLRLRKLEEAKDCLKKEMDYYSQVENQGLINKLVLGLVLVHLHQGDYVAADLAFRAAMSYTGFAESEEAGPINSLLDAYDQGDQAAADEVTKNPLFKFMENEFTKLARDLRVPGGQKVKATASQGDATAGPADEEDDYAGALL